MKTSEWLKITHDPGSTVAYAVTVARSADTGYWHLGATGDGGQVDQELDEALDALSDLLPAVRPSDAREA